MIEEKKEENQTNQSEPEYTQEIQYQIPEITKKVKEHIEQKIKSVEERITELENITNTLKENLEILKGEVSELFEKTIEDTVEEVVKSVVTEISEEIEKKVKEAIMKGQEKILENLKKAIVEEMRDDVYKNVRDTMEKISAEIGEDLKRRAIPKAEEKLSEKVEESIKEQLAGKEIGGLKVLVITPSGVAKDAFITEIIASGLLAFHSHNLEEAKKIFQNIKPEVVIIEDVEDYMEEAIKFIKEVKNNPETANTIFIGYVNPYNKENITNMLSAGVVGFIEKPLKKVGIISSFILETVKKQMGVPPERKLVRVKVPQNEVKFIFRSPKTQRILIGKVIDLSLGGIAMELLGGEELEKGDKIVNAKIELGALRKAVIKEAEVVCRDVSKNIYGIRFDNVDYECLKNIASYIYDILTFQSKT